MTVTIAYSDKKNKCAWMASDACASDAFNKSIVKNLKVFHPVNRRDVLLGIAGTFRLQNLLQFVDGIFPDENEVSTDDIDMSFLVNEFTPVIDALTSDFDDEDVWELLIAVGDRIYRMQMDLSIIEPGDTADAIGIGGQVCLGAFKVLNELSQDMNIEEQLIHALNIACSSCQGCMPPFTIMKTQQLPDEVLKNIKKDRKKGGYSIIRSKKESNENNDNGIVEDVSNKHKKRKKKKS